MKNPIRYLFLSGTLVLTGCIQEEPKNAECDIETASVYVETPSHFFYHDYDTLQMVSTASDSIGFLVRPDSEVGSLPLHLHLTAGAVPFILEESGYVPFTNGSLVDFADDRVRHFKIVSEDGDWSKQYRVVVVHDSNFEHGHMFMTFNFEQYDLEADGHKYYVWTETDPIAAAYLMRNDPTWKNGNPGFKLSMSSAKPLDYPTTPVVGGGPDGSDCIKLTTCDTGPFGRMVNYRLASGSFFIGDFDVANALKNALKATLFGVPFKHKPTRIAAWLRYEHSSNTFQNRLGEPEPGETDQPDFYAVMYRNQDADGNEVRLNGADVLSSPYIVGLARLPHPDHGLTPEWQHVALAMEYTEELDPELLENNGYSFTVSMASSYRGAEFEGTVGNTLYVDGITVECEF